MGGRDGAAGDPYEDDIVGWSEEQAARLRRVAAGEAPDAAGVDWANVVEEIEAVGRFARATVRAEFTTALLRVLMAHGWPGHSDAGRWLDAADTALVKAAASADAGMEGRLDLEAAYRDARRAAAGLRMDGRPSRALPPAVPVGFAGLRGPGCSSTVLLRRVRAAAGEGPPLS